MYHWFWKCRRFFFLTGKLLYGPFWGGPRLFWPSIPLLLSVCRYCKPAVHSTPENIDWGLGKKGVHIYLSWNFFRTNQYETLVSTPRAIWYRHTSQHASLFSLCRCWQLWWSWATLGLSTAPWSRKTWCGHQLSHIDLGSSIMGEDIQLRPLGSYI